MTGRENPEAAENAFYAAFAAGDFTTMMDLWAHDDEIICVHPLGPRLSGRAAIAASWRQLLTAEATRQFDCRIITKWHGDDLAVHMLDELISVPGSDLRFRPVIATNVYRRVDDAWYIIEHHASIDASDARADTDSATRH